MFDISSQDLPNPGTVESVSVLAEFLPVASKTAGTYFLSELLLLLLCPLTLRSKLFLRTLVKSALFTLRCSPQVELCLGGSECLLELLLLVLPLAADKLEKNLGLGDFLGGLDSFLLLEFGFQLKESELWLFLLDPLP